MVDDTPTQSSDRLDQIIADYLQAEETGEVPSLEELLAAHPDLANELRGFFADREQVHNLAAALPGEPPRKQFVPPKVRYFGDYELLDEIARGGMGVVYRARQTNLNRDVALKMMLSGHLAGEEDVKRFKTEAEAAGNLQHPGIVPIHDVGEHEGHHYFSMDYIEGRSLAEIVRENALPAERAAKYVQAIAEAVEYAHSQGTLHRDLKPSNILIDADDRVHVTDFGLAGRVDGDGDLTRTGQILGTPSYMPPEQAQGKRGLIGPASDVYSLGAILYELLTGRSPFRAESSIETLRQVIERDPVAPRALNANVPKDLETICLKCLRKEPDRRYNRASALAEDLLRWLNGKPIHARPVARIEKAWMWCKRRPSLVGVSLVAIVVLFVGSLISIERKNDGEATRLVEGLLAADTSQVKAIIEDLDEYQTWATDDLTTAFDDSPNDSNGKLHAALALLSEDNSVLEFLRERLLTVSPVQFGPVSELLYDHRQSLSEDFWPDLLEHYWTLATNHREESARRFQAACALANYDPENASWQDEEFTGFVAAHLAGVLPSALLPWQNALRPVRQHLTGPLTAIYHSDSDGKKFATDVLTDYLSDDPDRLFNLLADADQTQFPFIFAELTAHQERAIELGHAEIARRTTEDAGEDDKEALAIRQANAAVMLLRMDASETVWPLLKHSPDPRVRSYIIHRLSPLGADPAGIIARYEQDTDVTIQRALLLCLGEFDESRLPESDRGPLIETLLAVYRTNDDRGLHAAAEWLLRQWGQAEQIAVIDDELQQTEEQLRSNPNDQREWYVNGQGQTLVILDADEFVMGAPQSEADRHPNETRHQRRIGRRIAMSTKEVTKQQFLEFDPNFSHSNFHRYPEPDCPIGGVLWYEAAAYCNWLSEQEGIAEDQRCYAPNEQGQYGPGMRTQENFLELAGYRLPTEAEWEFACRAGAETSRYYGESETLLPQYSWYLVNSDKHAWPAASLKPNDFGAFDMLGNIFEWCHDKYMVYSDDVNQPTEDRLRGATVTDDHRRVLRGGSFFFYSVDSRSAYRYYDFPDYWYGGFGFRVARTYP